jgi:sulfatase maturation enzyme AslB (radical SAM superfamily)
MVKSDIRAQKVYFELTNRCNFHCDFCPIGESARPAGDMDWALYTRGIDEIAREGLAPTVGYHVLGEPLLYPRIDEAIRYAAERGLRTELNTNGSPLTRDRVERLMAAGLSQLTISLQTVGEAAHACRGTTLPYVVYYQRIVEAVRAACAAQSGMEVVVCFMDTATRRLFDMDKAMRLGPARAARAQLAGLVGDLLAAAGRPTDEEAVARAVARLNLHEPRYVTLSERASVYVQPLADWGNAFTARGIYPARIGACGYALQNVGVLQGGEVTICCADYDGHTALGNLKAATLSELLASPRAAAIREGFAHNRVAHPYCQRCPGSPHRAKAVLKGLASIYLFKWRRFEPARVQRIPLLPEGGECAREWGMGAAAARTTAGGGES